MNSQAFGRIELHYHLRGGAHMMNALVRNKCEAEALAVCGHIAANLGISLEIESGPFAEGGLRELWRLVGHNSPQLSLLLAVVVLIFSRVPVVDSDMDAISKELAKLSIEEKKLQIEKLKRELHGDTPREIEPAKAARIMEGDARVIARRSNFYRHLIDYENVAAVGFTPIVDTHSAPTEETVQRNDFAKFVFRTDKLPTEVVDGAIVEIVAPVLKEGNYQWKGRYLGRSISFAMLDHEFKVDVLQRRISFQNGSAIECVLHVHRRFDEVGDIEVTGYSVATVLAKSDGIAAVETAQGKQYRQAKALTSSQGKLFDGP